MDDRTTYSRYLLCDEELVVNISMPDGKVYHQRCILNSINNDLVDMGFTGEEMPEWMLVDVGTAIELRGRADRGSFGCRAVVVDRNIAGHYLVRLIGSIYYGELREFQRIDVYVPMKYTPTKEHSLEKIADNWLARKNEHKKNMKRGAAGTAWMDDTLSDNWDEIVPILAQSTNEGLRVDIPELFAPETHIDVELYLPLTPPKIISAVTEVIDVDELPRLDDGTTMHRTYLKFTLIDATDRDCINDYVSAIQVQHLGEISRDAQYQALYNRLTAQVERKDPVQLFKRIIAVALFAVLALLLFRYLDNYRRGHEKGLIEKVFEDGIRRYQEKFK